MKTKLWIYALPFFLFAMMLYGYGIQDYPNNVYQSTTIENSQQLDGNGPVIHTPSSTCTYSWTSQSAGSATALLVSVSTVSSKIGWAAGSTTSTSALPLVLRTIDGGATWTDATGTGITGDIYNIYAVSANIAFCTTSPGATNLYKTINGGTTWTLVFTQAGGFIDAIQMTSATEGYAYGDPVGGKWTILKTVNGGNTWARMATEPAQVGAEAGWNNSFLIIGTDIWFGTNVGSVYHSNNLGVTWTSVPTTGAVNIYALHFNSGGASGLGLVGGTPSATPLKKSIDGGASYSATNSPGSVAQVTGLEGIGTDWWAVTADDTVEYSGDQGATWSMVYRQGVQFLDIDFATESGCAVGWAVGTLGNIARMEPSGSNKTLQVFAYIEGCLTCGTPNSYIGDTATVEIRSTVSPYPIIAMQKAKSDSTGKFSITFADPIATGVPYYIVIRTKNGIETWSKVGQTWSGETLTYDFTSAATQAFGNNQKLKCGKYTIFNGDVNQNGVINLADILLISTDATNFVTGYKVTDLNCDNITNLLDILIAFTNSANFVVRIIPA
ncbi:MAG: hypothetical protein ABI462_04690 [Ignavibacteria bacterium]